jgi:hypothetical protein
MAMEFATGHMTAVTLIQVWHQTFAAAGFSIGALKGLSELSTQWQAMLARLWALPMIVLASCSCGTSSNSALAAQLA